jgi:Ni/Fe-hydrogenase subunit HybB-like protein
MPTTVTGIFLLAIGIVAVVGVLVFTGLALLALLDIFKESQ